MIPNRLFQTWKSKTEFPEKFVIWQQTFRDHNPEFEFVLWDDDDNRNFIEETYPWFLDTYDAYPAEIYRADAIRYFYLYHFGGLYADMDVECLKPLSDVLRDNRVILGRMGTNPEFRHSIPNAVMASEAHCEFWPLVIWMMMNDAPGHRPEDRTGPVLLHRAVEAYRNKTIPREWIEEFFPEAQPMKIWFAPGHVLYPLNWNDKIHQALREEVCRGRIFTNEEARQIFPKSLMTTYWSHTWGPK